MEELKVVLENGKGEVQLWLGDTKAGFMDITLTGGRLNVYHTEVGNEFGGKGYGRLLLAKLVEYARENGLKIFPFCPYVRAQFTKNPETYADVWFQRTTEG